MMLKMAVIIAVVVSLAGCGSTQSSQTGSTATSTSSVATKTYPKDALNKAAYNGDVEEVAAILKTKPDPDNRDSSGGTALHAAMFQKNIHIVEMLIDYGLDVNAIGPKNGYTPLHDAVWGNNPAAAKLLLEKGADPTIKNKEGQTPLEKAKSEGKEDLVEVLTGK